MVLHAFLAALTGEVADDALPDAAAMDALVNVNHEQSAQGKVDPADIKYGYCTQMMIRIGHGNTVTKQFEYQPFYDHLAKLGDSLLVVNDDEVVKVHVHTEHPDQVLGWGLQFGDLETTKIDNMRWQQEQIMERDEAEPAGAKPATVLAKAQKQSAAQLETAVIAVASGKGVQDLLTSLGVTHVISGGQTMNPSIADLVKAIDDSGAKQALLLPDNGNIFMAAKQAASVAKIPTKVVHAKTIAQAMSALLDYNPEAKLADNAQAMESVLGNVKSGEVTVAVRNTQVDGRRIKKDDYLGIVDGQIVTTAADVQAAAEAMVKTMLDEDSEVVTILYGQDGSKEAADQIATAIQAMDDELDVQVYEGDQPVYPYLIAVE